MTTSKIIVDEFPWPDPEGWIAATRGSWPAKWIRARGHEQRPLLVFYRLRLELAEDTILRVFCSGDERYDLYLDGERVGRGPERGDPDNWYTDAFDLDLSTGRHVLVARVWSAGQFTAPWSHVSLIHGFIMAPADLAWRDRLSTGYAPWECLIAQGFTQGTNLPGLRGCWHQDECFEGRLFPWDADRGQGEGWTQPETGAEGRSKFRVSWKHTWEHQLRPGELPPMRSVVTRPGRVVAVDRTVLEQATTTPFRGVGQDQALMDQVGCLLRGEPLHVPANTHLRILNDQGSFASDAPPLDALLPLCVRTLASCQHESFMDCPFYEQQLWVGDMLPQMLCTLVMTRDDRLIRRCLRFLADTRWASEGLVNGRYPAPQKLAIPSFALWWVHMVADYAEWRGDRVFIRRLMSAARDTVEHLLSFRQGDGLIANVPGWDYTDWTAQWKMGTPTGSPSGTLLSLLLSVTLDRLVGLEDWMGEPELSARWNRLAGELWDACRLHRFDAAHGRFADDAALTMASEQTQAVAALSPRMDDALRVALRNSLDRDLDLVRCSVFFDHHLIESYARLGLDQRILDRYATYDFVAQGLTTTPERLPVARSDCHAWSSHFRYHSVATVLGIRPATPGFEGVHIAPHMGGLRQVRGAVPHPEGGLISVELLRADDRVRGMIVLPDGVTGFLEWRGCRMPLKSGRNAVHSQG